MAEKGRVQVFARCRPPLPREEGERHAVSMDAEAKKVTVEQEDQEAVDRVLAGGDYKPKAKDVRTFNFDGVFDLASQQKDVFNDVGKPVLKDVLNGYNGAILAYGQTGAGKTHSLLNNAGGKPQEAGLLPRTVAALYVYIGSDMNSVYTVDAAAFQIYNEQIDDLLCEDRAQNNNLAVKVGGEVNNLTWKACKGPDDLLKLFQQARNNVVYAETKMNKASSRSHSVFQIKITKRPRATENKGGAVKMQAVMGKLTVVDLAGSERVKRSGVSGQGLKEAANINSSLLAFGNVVQALADKKKHVPFRDSKLTRILEDSVGGNCKTSLLVCCSPAMESSSETLNALEFAARAMAVETTCQVNSCTVTIDASRLAADLAGEGIDEAVRAKAREMQELQKSVAAKEATAAKEAKKWQEAAAKVKKEEGEKLQKEQALVAKYKAQVEEIAQQKDRENASLQARVAELEAEVADARAGHEALARVAEMEAEVAAVKEQMAAASVAADAQLADVRAAHEARVGELAATLETTSAHRAQAAEGQAELEERLNEMTEQLNEVQNELDAEREALDALQARMRQEAAAVEGRHQAALQALQAKHAVELEALHAEFAAAQKALVATHRAELNGAQAAAEAAVAAAEEGAAMRLAAREEELEGVRREQVAAKDAEIDTLNALSRNKDATIQQLHAQGDALEGKLEAAKRDATRQETQFRADISRVWDEAEAEKDKAAAAAAAHLHKVEDRFEEEIENLCVENQQRCNRQAGAFAAARGTLALKMQSLAQDMATLQRRFDARESRADDVQRIRMLERELRLAQQQERNQAFVANQLQLELDNRDCSDQVFGLVNRGPGATLGKSQQPKPRAFAPSEPLRQTPLSPINGNVPISGFSPAALSRPKSGMPRSRSIQSARYVSATGFRR